MTLRPELLPLLFALTLASFACRAGGFWLMRFVAVTPRLRATLAAAPLSVMLGIVTPAALRGGLPEIVGLAATFLAMHLWRRDLVATFVGVGAVAVCRFVQ
ncbi:MAG: AzlD domain-containing protein [Betaproteobacteria bacterium]